MKSQQPLALSYEVVIVLGKLQDIEKRLDGAQGVCLHHVDVVGREPQSHEFVFEVVSMVSLKE